MRRYVTARRGEDGSALIIALVFVTAISLMVAAVLAFADVGVRSSKAYKQGSGAAYAADGAIAAAMKRYSTTGPCDNFTAPLVEGAPDTPVNGQGLIVRCEGPPPAGAKATQPLNSLLSLGTDPDADGIASTEELRLLGDVFSNTTVKAGPRATMVVQGEVSALGQCTGPIQTVPPKPLRCSNTGGGADESRGRDPQYVPARTAVPERRSVPPCPAGWLVTMEPGYYDDADALNALTSSPDTCKNKVVWFRPGTYYFNLGFRVGSTTWTVDNDSVTVVGGTPKGWDPAADPAGPTPALNVPGSCKTEDDPGPGVQLIAGGATRLNVIKGRMELCATPSTTDQQIALFGLGPEIPARTLEAADVTPTGFTACSPPTGSACAPALNAQTILETPDPTTAVAALRSDPPSTLTSASLEFKEFRPRVPLGSVIDAVGLRVRHREDNGPVDVSFTANFPASGRPPSECASPQPLPASPGTTDDRRIDLKGLCRLETPEQLVGLVVSYTASLASGATSADVQVDGVVVEISYRTPVTRRPTFVQTSTGFANPAHALEIGEQNAPEVGQEPAPLTADATIASTTNAASITLGGLGEAALAAGPLDSAVLRVAHRTDGDTAGPKVSVGTCTDVALPTRSTIGDERIDLRPCGVDRTEKLKGLTATFTAALEPDGDDALSQLDGMWVEVVPSGPAGPAPGARQPAAATSTQFVNAEQAKVIGEQPVPLTADATLAGASNAATLRVDSFGGVAVPPGARINSAKLRVAHQENAGIGQVGIDAVVPGVPGDPRLPGGTCAFTALPRSTDALAQHTAGFDLSACGLRSPEQLAGVAATYTASRTTTVASSTQLPVGAESAAGDFTNPDAALRIDGRDAALAALVPIAKPVASLTLTGFTEPAPPPGSSLETATLRIAHQDDGAIGSVEVKFQGSTCAAAPLDVRPGALALDRRDLKACGLDDPAKLDGLSVVYKAELAPGAVAGTALLDGVELDLTYRPPGFARLDGIELDVVFEAPAFQPVCPSARCDLVKVAPRDANDTATRFVASGTIYSPAAGIDISMYGLRTQVIRRGVVARAIRLGLQPAPDYKRPTGVIPPEVVRFTAYPDVTLRPDEVTPTGFTNPEGAKLLRDGQLAVAELGGVNPTTASLVLKAYDKGLPETLGDSAVIDAATLRVRHQDIGNTVEVAVKMVGEADPCVTKTLGANPTALSADGRDGEDQVDLGPCGIDTPAKLDDVTVTYTVTKVDDETVPTATAKLDGITLEILSGPLVRANVTFDRAKATVKSWNVLR